MREHEMNRAQLAEEDMLGYTGTEEQSINLVLSQHLHRTRSQLCYCNMNEARQPIFRALCGVVEPALHVVDASFCCNAMHSRYYNTPNKNAIAEFHCLVLLRFFGLSVMLTQHIQQRRTVPVKTRTSEPDIEGDRDTGLQLVAQQPHGHGVA